jgi:hypothetical protein
VKEIMLKEGDKVVLTYDTDQVGTITRWGPFVCEVKFTDKVTRYIVNRFLRRVK